MCIDSKSSLESDKELISHNYTQAVNSALAHKESINIRGCKSGLRP